MAWVRSNVWKNEHILNKWLLYFWRNTSHHQGVRGGWEPTRVSRGTKVEEIPPVEYCCREKKDWTNIIFKAVNRILYGSESWVLLGKHWRFTEMKCLRRSAGRIEEVREEHGVATRFRRSSTSLICVCGMNDDQYPRKCRSKARRKGQETRG